MQRLLIGAGALLLACGSAFAQTADDLKRDGASSKNVLTYGMGYGLQRFSALKQINISTVTNLVPVWNYSLASDRGEETQPLFLDGVIYATTHNSTVAVDALTGKQIWKAKIEYPPETLGLACCGIVNRGGTIFDGKLYRTTLDAHVIALDIKTGKEVWRSKAIDIKDGYSFTVAPLVANGVVITGISGGEYGTRGFIDGWDPANGNHLWRRYTIPEPGEKNGDTWPGDTWKRGGAPAWITGSYDPDLDLVYWGTGNGGPWNAEFRKGDNLYICSVLAIRPKTGEIVWHYQFSPNDPYDYDSVNELVQADMTFDGQLRKVIMQANRNGFFYVLDRTNGKLLAANPFVSKVNWADGIDMKSGRPVESKETIAMRKGQPFTVWPSALGGKNWMPMSYDPETKLAYANTLNIGMPYKPLEPEYRQGVFYLGVDLVGFEYSGPRGFLKAIDPATGKSKWEVPFEIPNFSGVMTTAGGLVFTGAMTGEFMAFDANDGKKLWQFQTGSGIISSPIAWERDGKQYITVASGIGGVYVLFSGDERLASIPTGGSLWTFALKQ
jgi:alcohol dehydrogenase (cytochrome c)